MISLYSVLFTLVVFSEFCGHSVTLAIPARKLDEGMTGQESLGSILATEEGIGEPAAGAPLYRRSPIMDNKLDEDGNPKIIILSDVGMRGHSRRGLKPAFVRGPPLLADNTPAEYGLKMERRESDIDMLRCMIGRVYRPCWRS